MPTVIVASTNPVKIECAHLGFLEMFPDEPFAAGNRRIEIILSDG